MIDSMAHDIPMRCLCISQLCSYISHAMFISLRDLGHALLRIWRLHNFCYAHNLKLCAYPEYGAYVTPSHALQVQRLHDWPTRYHEYGTCAISVVRYRFSAYTTEITCLPRIQRLHDPGHALQVQRLHDRSSSNHDVQLSARMHTRPYLNSMFSSVHVHKFIIFMLWHACKINVQSLSQFIQKPMLMQKPMYNT
jgi:uncharacterized membrane protein YhaH (DUF805 family)